MFILAESASIVPKTPQRLGEVRRETVQCVNDFRLDSLYHIEQVREIGMVAERKGSVALITKPAVRVHSPTGQDGCAGFAKIAEHGGVHNVRRAQQHLAASRAGFITLVFGEALPELLVDLRQLENRSVQHQRKAVVAQAAKQFLTFAQRVAQ